MVGLGEERDELLEVFADLRASDVDVLTVGQYLRPTMKHLPVERYVAPNEFAELKTVANDWASGTSSPARWSEARTTPTSRCRRAYNPLPSARIHYRKPRTEDAVAPSSVRRGPTVRPSSSAPSSGQAGLVGQAAPPPTPPPSASQRRRPGRRGRRAARPRRPAPEPAAQAARFRDARIRHRTARLREALRRRARIRSVSHGPGHAAVYGYEHQEPMYLPLALSVGAGFKFGCGFMLAVGVACSGCSWRPR